MKVLIVGLGSIARKHISALNALYEQTELYAWRSSAESEVESGIEDLFTWEQVSEHTFDFTIISNPTAQHRNTISQLSQLGIPMFIEKPLFEKTGDGEQQLVERIQSLGVWTYVACNLRFLACVRYIKDKISGQTINEVNVYCGSYLPDWRPGKDFRRNYSANEEQGGGVHIDLIHELDYLFWLFGTPQQSDALFTRNSSLHISAFDYANYRWQYDTFTAAIILNYYRRDAQRSLEIVCEKGTYKVDLLKNQVSFAGNIVFLSDQRIGDTYTEQMQFFVEHLKSGTRPGFNSVSEAYKILNLCLHQS